MRWSTSRSATGSPRSWSCRSVSRPSAPDDTGPIRYSRLYGRSRSRPIALSTCGSSSTARMAGSLAATLPLRARRRMARQDGLDALQLEAVELDDRGVGTERGRHDGLGRRLVVHVHDHPRLVHAVSAAPLRIREVVGPGGKEHLDHARARPGLGGVRHLDQELGHQSPPQARLVFAPRGRITRNSVRPGRDSNSIWPSCWLTSRRAMSSPRPVPWPTGLVVKNGSNSFSAIAGGTPGPSSTTLTMMESVPRHSALTST